MAIPFALTVVPGWVPRPLSRPCNSALRPVRSFNSYGLFAVMTTERIEIEIEGSQDGVRLAALSRSLPSREPLDRAPSFVAPCAAPAGLADVVRRALGTARNNPWFARLLAAADGRFTPGGRICSKRVPFDSEPPRYVRAIRYRYQFTRWANEPCPSGAQTAAGRAACGPGRWWRRERLDQDYFPPVSLSGRLKPSR